MFLNNILNIFLIFVFFLGNVYNLKLHKVQCTDFYGKVVERGELYQPERDPCLTCVCKQFRDNYYCSTTPCEIPVIITFIFSKINFLNRITVIKICFIVFRTATGILWTIRFAVLLPV